MRKVLTPRALTLRMSRAVAVAALSVAAIVGSACGSSSPGTDAALPTVVVTTSIIGDMVTEALGDLVGNELNVEVIVPVGADAHEFAPSAKQAETMENATLLVVNGLGYEEVMADVIDNAMDSGAVVFPLAGQLEATAGTDPHVWLDPVLMAETFATLPPIVSATTAVPIGDVQANVDAYIARLRELDDTVTTELSAVDAQSRRLITNHDSLSRFADRYDFTVIDTIIPSVSTSAQASAADLDEVLRVIRAQDVRAIFSDSTSSDDLAQALASELGETVTVVELYTESLGEPGSGADTYVGMMTVNAERIAAALR